MIVDTSAIMAIILREPEAPAILREYIAAQRRAMSAGSWIELQAVLTRRGDGIMTERIDRLTREGRLHIEPVTVEQAEIGRIAYRTFGRGSRHPACLNFGDCFAYALAKATGEPLLFKGEDFSKTDIRPAIPT